MSSIIIGTPDPKSPLSLNFVMLVVGVVMIVVSVVLWVAVGFQVGLQDSEFCWCFWYMIHSYKQGLHLEIFRRGGGGGGGGQNDDSWN